MNKVKKMENIVIYMLKLSRKSRWNVKPISSYFNPCSKRHDALTNFKQLSCLKQVGIGFVVSLVAIIFAPFAVPVFRLLNECCVVKKELNDAEQRTQNIYSRIQGSRALPPREINLDNVNKPMQAAPKPTVSAIPEKAPAPSTTSSTTPKAAPLEPEKAAAPVEPLSTSSSTTSTAAPTLEPEKAAAPVGPLSTSSSTTSTAAPTLEPKKATAPVASQKTLHEDTLYRFTKEGIERCISGIGLNLEQIKEIADNLSSQALNKKGISRAVVKDILIDHLVRFALSAYRVHCVDERDVTRAVLSHDAVRHRGEEAGRLSDQLVLYAKPIEPE